TYAPPPQDLVGRTIDHSWRRGKFLVLEAAGDPPIYLVMHLARAGWVRWRDTMDTKPVRPGKGPLALRVLFEGGGGFEATEAGTEHRLAVYVVRDPSDIEHFATLGPDPLDPSFDRDALGKLLAGQRGQLKTVLTDQRVIAGVGNAYSDEALHMAKLSPFKNAAKLTPDDVTTLHDALVAVLTDAVERSAGLPAAGLKKEKKEGLRVHARTREPCPVCGDTIRQVVPSSQSFQY